MIILVYYGLKTFIIYHDSQSAICAMRALKNTLSQHILHQIVNIIDCLRLRDLAVELH